MKNRLKKKDIVLMIIILVVAGSCVLLHRIIGEKSADYITVKVNGKIEGVYSLADDQEIVLNNGSNVLKIKNGEADMIRADCPDQLRRRFLRIKKVLSACRTRLLWKLTAIRTASMMR